MKPLLLIDSNAACHKAKHTVGELTNETMHVGVIFGFLLQMLKLAKQEKSNRFAFCWDGDSSHRRKIFPDYKRKRREAKEEKTEEEKELDAACYVQFDQIYNDILPRIGFKNNFKFDGFEGDDIIASIVDYSSPDSDIVMVTGDEDMLQCLCAGVSMQTKTTRWTAESFFKEKGIHPSQWAEVKAIAGCESDEVPGIKGIGESLAIDYLLNKMKKDGKRYASITSGEGGNIIGRNRKLVTLPFEGCPIVALQPDELNFEEFIKICNELNFQYILRKQHLIEWKTHIFTGVSGGLF